MKILVTGSSGLIGSEVVNYFAKRDHQIIGLDNNMRADFFGPDGDTRWNQKRLENDFKNFTHFEIDIRDRNHILSFIEKQRPDVIIHTAAQPSHDLAAKRPFDDFDVNAVGTFNLLEACRQFCIKSSFIHLSTNKVYGDAPNKIKLKELETRWEFDDNDYINGISESFTIDQSKHSIFGASKLSGDIMVQEYGRYFGMNTACLRGGCLTGPNHTGVELHGFLSYLIKTNLEEKNYNVFGYKGKQVRDNIHSYDVATFIDCFIQNPRQGEVYNIGGGKNNSISILEAFKLVESISGKEMKYQYVDTNREGDHICYYSDLSKIQAHYPTWKITKNIPMVFNEIVENWYKRLEK
jgi:CDP-paratose 2-epimerase